jgi:4-amino-4-deoxy-L-arabinose transferase-like glycosyltransferase
MGAIEDTAGRREIGAPKGAGGPLRRSIPAAWSGPHVVAIGAVVVAFLALAIVESALRPVYEAPDEISHLHYVQVITDHLALPGAGIHERQQPPLYYLIAAPLALAGPDLESVRALSLLCGVVVICLCAVAAREVWPVDPGRWVAAALVAAAVPEVGYLAGSASDENLAWVMGALLLVVALRVVHTPAPTPRLLVGCGALIGLAIITRLDDWPLAALVIGVMVWRWRGLLLTRWTAVAAVAMLAGSAWWFARNLWTFGSPLPPMQPLAAHGSHTLQSLGQVRTLLSQLVRGLAGTYGDGQVVVFNEIGRNTTLSATACAVAVFCIGGGAIVIGADRWRRWESQTRAAAVVLGLAPCLQLAAVVANAIVVDLQPQTRYMLAALPAFAIATVAVAAECRRRMARPVAITALAAAGAVALTLDVSGIDTATSLPPFTHQAVPDRPSATSVQTSPGGAAIGV